MILSTPKAIASEVVSSGQDIIAPGDYFYMDLEGGMIDDSVRVLDKESNQDLCSNINVTYVNDTVARVTCRLASGVKRFLQV